MLGAFRSRFVSHQQLSIRSRRQSFYRLGTEPLEDRRLLAITVDTLVDEADGSIVDGDISLRDAIALAPAGETIDFAPELNGGTITLTLGELVVNESLTIDGPGADLLTIDASGNDPTPDENNGDGSRVIYANTSNSSSPDGFVISGLTLTGGDSASDGGAMFSVGNTTLMDMVITDNATTRSGGGVYLLSTATVANSLIANNSARDGGGVSLRHLGSDTIVTFDSSTIRGNMASRRGGGISIVAQSATTTIANSTINDNYASDGGGIFVVQTFSEMTISNSTISANTASNNGGGVSASFTLDDGLRMEHVTITNNVANGALSGVGGGGLFTSVDVPPVLSHTIIAGNVAGPTASVPEIWGPVRANRSMIGDDTGATVVDEGGNLIGTAVAPIDPMLAPLAPNGGATLTHALLPGSPAIDAGDPLAVTLPEFDQRGAPFAREYGAAVDIGAFERQTVAGLSLVVDTLLDESDGDYSNGDFSLREAAELANGSIGSDLIEFAPALDGGTITLSLDELLLVDTTVIDASALGGGLTIDASGNDPTPLDNLGDGSRVLNVDGTSAGSLAALELRGLTLTGGDVTGDGGAIRSIGNLTLTGVQVIDNYATGLGGGVTVDAPLGATVVTSSTISGNDAGQSGGGIFVKTEVGATTTISDSELSGNTAYSGGGGWFSNFGGAVSIAGSTISGNVARRDGGGVWLNALVGGVTTLSDSTVIDNAAEDGQGGGIHGYALANGAINITRSTISGNSATKDGGGVYARAMDAIMTIDQSTVSQNTTGDNGGGVYLEARSGSTLTITNTTISQNTSTRDAAGAYIWSTDESITNLTGMTISGNISSDNAGGIVVQARSDTTVVISKSTISGNLAESSGGGGLRTSSGGTILLEHSTVTENVSSSDVFFPPLFPLGGISVGVNVTIRHSIIARNRVPAAGVFTDIEGDVSASGSASAYNLIGVDTNQPGSDLIGITDGVNGNMVGSQGAPIDPLLGSLADNGGPTMTHALLPGSPAIDAGDPTFVPPPSTDQRGYYRVIDGNGDMTARVDIGAFEYASVPPLAGDGNLDGEVDGLDYLIWAMNYDDNPADDPPGSPENGDYNGDGVVDGLDYLVWATNFGATIPAATVQQAAHDVALETASDDAATVDSLLGQSLYYQNHDSADDTITAAVDKVLSALPAKKHRSRWRR